MRLNISKKSNEIGPECIRHKVVYFFLFASLNIAVYYAVFTKIHVRTRYRDGDRHYYINEKKPFIQSVDMDTPLADVNSVVGPRIIIDTADAKTQENKTNRNETEYDTKKLLETPAHFISGIGEAHLDSGNKGGPEINPEQNSKSVGATKRKIPRFLFGHSTGHSGSTSVQRMLKAPGCPWYTLAKFEDASSSEITVDYPKCENTTNYIAPRISTRIEIMKYSRNTTYIDMGHFHNRGRTIECLADYFREDAAFVHIRRNRYDIAHSFSHNKQTPCRGTKEEGLKHPAVSVCPRSDENAGSVNLPVDDEIWDALTPFQRFLWYADEMEHRWYMLKAAHQDGHHISKGNHARPMFLELTWSSSEQLTEGMNKIRRTLGCTIIKTHVSANRHIKHENRTTLCALYIQQDYEYRRLMNYDTATLQILVSSQFPQHMKSEECIESPDEIKGLTRFHAGEHGIPYDEDTWVFPS